MKSLSDKTPFKETWEKDTQRGERATSQAMGAGILLDPVGSISYLVLSPFFPSFCTFFL